MLASKSKSRQSLLSHLIRSMADLPSPSSSAADDDAVAARLAAAAHVPLDRARFFFEAAGGDEGVALRMMQGAKEDIDRRPVAETIPPNLDQPSPSFSLSLSLFLSLSIYLSIYLTWTP